MYRPNFGAPSSIRVSPPSASCSSCRSTSCRSRSPLEPTPTLTTSTNAVVRRSLLSCETSESRYKENMQHYHENMLWPDFRRHCYEKGISRLPITSFFAKSVHIMFVLPQAAQLSIHFLLRKISSVAPL